MDFIENVNIESCKKLSKLSYSQFKKFYCNQELDENNNDMELKEQYKLLIDYCIDMINNNFQKKMTYNYSRDKKCGRIFVSNKIGLQRIWKKFRGILSKDIYNDYDMINAGPSILLYLCKKYNIKDTYKLTEYINNRERILEAFNFTDSIIRDDAKILIIKSINSKYLIHKFNNKKIKNKFFIDFDNEMKKIQSLFLEIKDFNDTFLKLNKIKNDNLGGSLLNFLMVKTENNILQKVINFYNLKECVPMFDGVMIHNKYNIDINILNNISNEYNIFWSLKSHDTSIILDELELNDNLISCNCKDFVEVKDLLIKTLLNDRIYNCNETLWFNKENNIWITGVDKIRRHLLTLISKQDIYVDDILISKKVSSIEDIIKLIIADSPENDDFENELWNTTIYKICYKNGYYDFKLNNFKKYNKYIRTSIYINRDYIPINNKDKIIDEFYNRVLYPIFDVKFDENGNLDNNNKDKYDYLKYILKWLARRVAGHIEDKSFGIFEGLRNSGKGCITDALKNCFGKYILTTNAGNFIYNKNLLADCAKSNSWILDYQYSRLAITQEINITNDKNTTTKLDGNSIKRFCSGGDYISARKNYGDEIEFKIQSGLLICCNDFPQVSPNDTLEFAERFNMKSKFMKEQDYIELDENLKSTFSYWKADDTIKEYIRSDDAINAFTNILIHEYYNNVKIPLCFKQEKIEANEEDNEIIKLYNLFIFTNNNNDKITNKQLDKICRDEGIIFSQTKITKLLKIKGCIPFRSSQRGLSRLRIKTLADTDDED